jgi:hypothetical protein
VRNRERKGGGRHMTGEWKSANGQLGEPQYPGNPTDLHYLSITFLDGFIINLYGPADQ